MIRVRFHGRGGQGAKTASRILGTAAFKEGFTAQDSPIYGAERRGAPVAAFTRFTRGPILERGLIASPDLVVVADETLLSDPAARVCEGVTDATAVFVNTMRAPDALRKESGCPGRVTTLDLTGLVLAKLGKVGVLSVVLGAVAARLVGFSAESLRAAVAEELGSLGLSPSVIEQDHALAAECFQTVPVVPVGEGDMGGAQPGRPASLWTPVYEPPTKGTARIAACANAPQRKTGDWRVFRPVLEPEKCNGCALCFVYCPEAAITLTANDRPVIDYDHCKGCMLCVEECPTKALKIEREATTAKSE
ncbi:MAG: 2-oxoacid:acceptor oxidoreductase family protein [Nitrospirae bacterium]|nr:2-oxoacid:acceptor oxidoreductase family protein [Nitrospirota bacterium]